MNKFTKDNLHRDGQYLLFGPNRKFVARFKHGGPFTMTRFRKELMANHTPESYFKQMTECKAPLTILKDANPAWYDGIMMRFRLGALDNHPMVQMAKRLN